jgi:tetratricopeptide (TPR) repeat protein/DNA-binding CsgD family transcriptional regulator
MNIKVSHTENNIRIFYIVLVGMFMLLFYANAKAESSGQLIDSFRQIAKQSTDKHQQIIINYQLAKLYEQQNTDSAFYFTRKGLNTAIENEIKTDQAEGFAILGDLFIINDQLDSARINYTKASQLFKDEGKLFDYTQISMLIANIFLAQNKLYESLKIYQDCLELAEENGFKDLIPHIYNNLGVLYLRISDFREALNSFNSSLALFREQNDDYNAAHAISNIAAIYEHENDPDKALEYYLESGQIYYKLERWGSFASIQNSIANINLNNGDQNGFEEYLNLALNVLENNTITYEGPISIYSTQIFTNASKLYFDKNQLDKSMSYARKSLNLSLENSYNEQAAQNCEIISKIYEKQGLADSALYYHKRYAELSDKFQLQESIRQTTQLKMQHEFSEALKENEIERIRTEAQHRQKELFYLGIVIIVLLSVLVLLLLYFNQKNKTAKAELRKKNLELEKTRLDQDLAYKSKELTTNMMYLLEKNEFIVSIARKLDELKVNVKSDNKAAVQKLINELKQNSSKQAWEEFEMRYMEVHQDFYNALNKAYPDLTLNEKKLCAFLRLNMSTKEISAITHQSVSSINMARFRLRKKMNIDHDENLISLLSKL